MSDEYRVQLDVFTGPLDLLLYLIRRDELDIQDIPIARLTEQYLNYVKLLEELDPNVAGDFLVMASTLVELKSRALLPSPPLEAEDEDNDPRTLLVRQLLEYKRFKDAAEALGTAADDRAARFVRRPANLPKDLQGVELEEAQVWDLLSAFGRVMSSIGQGPGIHEVSYDDTPISEYKDLILDTLERKGSMKFQSLFADRSNRGEVIGLFLAILELLRGQRMRAEQDTPCGEIYLFLLEEAPIHEDDEPEEDELEEDEYDDGEALSAGLADPIAKPDAEPQFSTPDEPARPDEIFRRMIMSKPSERLAELGLSLPTVPEPVAAYVPFVTHGDVITISGQVPVKDGKIAFTGPAGKDQPLEAAQESAKICALNAIAVGAAAAGGIDKIDRVLKVIVYVNSQDGFSGQHLVANGASDLVKAVFGDAGTHARAAVGVSGLPLGATTEVDITFTMKQ